MYKLLLVSFVLACLGPVRLLFAQATPSNERARAEEARALSEGYVLHKADGSLYHYRILADSTIELGVGKGAENSPALALPATTFEAIYERAEKHLFSEEPPEELLALGYEDRSFIVRFARRFDAFLLGGGLFIGLAFAGVAAGLWRRLRRERRRRMAAEATRRSLAEGREKERRRLAREIHDGPVQDLHGLHMQLIAKLGRDGEPLGEALMRVARELRAVSADLRPPALEAFGLAAALRSFAGRFEERHPRIAVELDLEETGELPEALRLALFRIAQEAMNNAAAHAGAEKVRVHLRSGGKEVHLAVEDDGQGFAVPEGFEALVEEEHFGLTGMAERAEAVGAALDVDSRPGKGARVAVRVPRSEKPASVAA